MFCHLKAKCPLRRASLVASPISGRSWTWPPAGELTQTSGSAFSVVLVADGKKKTPAPDNRALNLKKKKKFCVMYKLFLARVSGSLNNHSELVALTSLYELP